MRNLSTALTQHLAGELLTLATCWRIQRTDNQIFGFTDFSSDLNFAGTTYKSSVGFKRTAVSAQNNLAVANISLDGILDADGITEADLVGGKFYEASVMVFLVNWNALPSSLTTLPLNYISLLSGTIGEVRNNGRGYNAEVRSLAQLLQQNQAVITQPLCRAEFGDPSCGVNLAPYTFQMTTSAVVNRGRFTATPGRPNTTFAWSGKVTFTSGANAGVTRYCGQYQNSQFVMLEPFPFPVAIGDTITAVQGCNKRLNAVLGCSHYSNTINFQGEPYLPGQDVFLAGFIR